jgi:twitching motility two-component system response regulator PilG
VTEQLREVVQAGVAAAKAGDRGLARALLRQAIRLAPAEPTGWIWLASVTEDGEEKLAHLRRFLEIQPGHPKGSEALRKTLLELGIELGRKGDKARSRALLTELVDLEPRNERAWLWLSSVAASAAEAVAALQRVLEIQPGHEQALSLLQRLDPGPAARPAPAWSCPLCAQTAPAPQARCPRCLAVLGLNDLDAVLKNKEADEKLLHEAVIRLKNLKDGDLGFEFQHHLAVAYLNLKKLDEAARHLELATRLHPEDKDLRRQLAELERRRAPPAAAETKPEGSARRTILAVDDSPTMQKIVSMTLERRGYRVIAASNGMEALSMLNAVRPDLVLLDINLPQMDGYQLCRFIRARESTRDVKIVMLASKDGFFDRVRGRMAGAVEYMTKPFNPELLVQVVEKHCRPVVGDGARK